MPLDDKRLLKNAPIVEALIDVRVTPADSFTQTHLEGVKTQLGSFFSSVEEQKQGELFFQIVEGRVAEPPTVADRGVTGLLFRASDRQEAVQVQEGGFVFSKLRPYSSWEDVSTSARRYWEIYSSAIPLKQVNRLAVRYINHFVVPRHKQLSDYLTAPPAVPEGVEPASLMNSLSRLLLVGPGNLEARLQLACDTADFGSNVLMDIDCFRAVQFEPSADTFWPSLQELREMKNRIFFGSITRFAEEEFNK
jgi:uncharacterized protein (TIGR04255 family)